jgi:thermitase
MRGRVGAPRLVWLLAVVGLCLGLTMPPPARAAQEGPRVPHDREPTEVRPGEILVKFKAGARDVDIAETHRRNGGQEREELPGARVHVVSVAAGDERTRAARYRSDPNVEFAEVNGLYYALGYVPNDPRYPSQWQYENTGQTGGTPDADIDASGAWQKTLGSSSVAIAILDTGIDQSHEDLKAKVTRTKNFTTSRTVDDQYGHGTHVAGSAAAATSNRTGVAGTCPSCSLWNVKVLGDKGSGDWSAIASGIIWAADNRAQVISMSFGSYSPSQTVQSAVDYAWGKGVVLVGAAGNDGQNWGLYPAAYPNVLAVGATDNRDARASFSNFGSNWISLGAPGADILSTATDHHSTLFPSGPKYGILSGTSMATPHVAGVAGLVLSTTLCTGAGANGCVRNQLQSTADPPGRGTDWIYGRLNACRAVGGTAC